jgi:universal stress protein A
LQQQQGGFGSRGNNMARFRSLLLALDLESESRALIDRVLFMYPDELEHLHVVHVVKQGLYQAQGSADSPDADRQRLLDHARLQLRELLWRHGLAVGKERIHLLQGEPAFEIKRLAAELDAELVIVGSHCKPSDWLQVPGPTTNCVIQGISTDVMAVKI